MNLSPKETLSLLMRTAEAQRFGVVAEHRFDPVRLWRFDYAFPEYKVAIEYNGHHSTGAKIKGAESKKTSGHSSILGITRDAEKGNHASLQGWHVIRLTALHFDPKARKKEKLTEPWSQIKTALDARLRLKG